MNEDMSYDDISQAASRANPYKTKKLPKTQGLMESSLVQDGAGSDNGYNM